MQRYHRLGMQVGLNRVVSGLHEKTLGILLGGATHALISWRESGRSWQPQCPMLAHWGHWVRWSGCDPRKNFHIKGL